MGSHAGMPCFVSAHSMCYEINSTQGDGSDHQMIDL
jgi:hypothetical protein